MNELTKFLVDSILNEAVEQVTALFGGGFKPPTKGHLDVILNGLKQNPEINRLKIIVGGGERDGITQDQATEIWNFYNDINLIPISDVEIIKASPFNYYKEYLKTHPDDKTFIFIGSREGDDKDQIDVKQRSEFVKKYSDNVIPVEVSTVGGVSGTEARKSFKTDLDSFRQMLPPNLIDSDFNQIVNILNGKSTNNTQEPTPTKTEPLNPVKEAIIGDKIECDNCGWSWEIIDGGDDLFTCHKCWHDNTPTLNEADPKKGTGKKPKGSKRRLYTDEDPKDTVGIKFSTRQDIVDTLNKKSFKAKSHARQSQIINLIHQRVRAAYGRAKDPAVKKRLKTGLDYITDKKEASKKKTQRMKKQKLNEDVLDQTSLVLPRGKKIILQAEEEDYNRGLIVELTKEGGYKINYWYGEDVKIYPAEVEVDGESIKDDAREVYIKFHPELEKENIDPKSQAKHKGKSAPFGSAYEPVDEGDTYEKMAAKGKKAGSLKQGTVRKRLKIPKDKKIPLSKINKEISRLKKMDKDKDKKGVQLGDKNQKYYKALQLSKTLKTTTNINENATYSSKIDYKQQIKDLTKHMLKKGMNILPLPKVIFKHGDQENASQFLGKTAYYSPSDMTVVLYTEGRHPKDIVRSFSHEMIHHIQNLEDRLENISTTNTMEDDNLNDIEREAYTKGNMTFRNWTDSLDGEEVTSLNEKIVGEKIECDNCGWSWNIVDGGDDLYMCHKCGHDNEPESGDPFGLKAYARELMEDFNIEDIKPATKSLEEQKRVRIFTTNCGCDKT